MPQTCTVCGGTLTPHLLDVRDPLTKEGFSIERCLSCGLGHTIPQPQDMAPYYAPQYYGNRHGFTLRQCIKRRLGFVQSVMQPSTPRRLLDIGCGDGSFLLAAKEMGWDVMGTELDSEPAKSAGLQVRESIDKIPLTELFDCITMWHSLEHMPDIKSTLTRIGSLLKPDGRLLIAVPDNGGFQAKTFGRKWFHLDVPRHLYHFDVNSLRYSLESTGYSIHRLWHQEFEYDLLGWSQSALNCIIPYPNVFFDFLTGKQKRYGKWMIALSFVLGSALTLLAVPLVAGGTLAGCGGTIVVSAGCTKEPQRG